MSLVKTIDNGNLKGKIFNTKYGYYFRIYFNKKEIAQMYYNAPTLEQAEEELMNTFDIIDEERLEKL